MTSRQPAGSTIPTARCRSGSRRGGSGSSNRVGTAVAALGLAAAALAQDGFVPREQRIAEQRTRLAERLIESSHVPWRAEYAAELARMHATWLEGGGEAKYVPARDGWVPAFSARLIQLLDPELAICEPEHPADYLADVVVPTIVDFDRQLAAHDLELVVVLVPARVHVYPEVVCPAADDYGRCYAPGLTRFELALLDAGVEVVDLIGPFSRERAGSNATAPDAEQLMLRANTHWAPRGVAVAAEAIARRLGTMAWYERPEGRSSELVRFESTDTGIAQPLLEGTPVFHFERVLDGRSTTAPYTDRQSPLVLLGDSYVTNYLGHGADVGRHLYHHLGLAPDSISIKGGGAVMVRRVLGRRKDPAEGKRAVLWMFTAGTLLKPEKQWRRIAIFDQ